MILFSIFGYPFFEAVGALIKEPTIDKLVAYYRCTVVNCSLRPS